MELVIFIVVLALFQYLMFAFQTAMARKRYDIRAPAVSGHPVFERHFRVQQNTIEQLVVFIPAIVAFAWTANGLGWPGQEIAAFLGVIWLVGRVLYARAYVRDPRTRQMGMLLTLVPGALLLLGALLCVLLSVI